MTVVDTTDHNPRNARNARNPRNARTPKRPARAPVSSSAVSLAFALALALAAPGSFAHDAWVAPTASATGYPIEYGHLETMTYAQQKVKEVRAWDAKGRPIDVELTRGDAGVVAKPAQAPAMMTVTLDNGYWTKVDGKSRNVGKREAPGATESSHPLKYGKTIWTWGDAAFEPVGQPIEIVPERFDGEPTPGRPITVRVLRDGKPLANLVVLGDREATKATTDANGRATFTVARGVQRLSAEQRTSIAGDPDADTLALSASLTFVAR
ncbi:MAG: DUF4198 domain-containing protein [Lautropia sp.]